MLNQDSMSISELADAAGVTIRTVRYYMAEGLLPPSRLKGRYRVFDQSDLNRLELIRRWKESFLPLKEIRDRIISLSNAEVETLLHQLAAETPAFFQSQPPSSSIAAPQPRSAGETEESTPASSSFFFADGSYAAASQGKQTKAAASPKASSSTTIAGQSAVNEPGNPYEAGTDSAQKSAASPQPADDNADETGQDAGQSALEYIRGLRQKQNLTIPPVRPNPRRTFNRGQEWRHIQIFPGFEIHVSEAVYLQFEQQLEALMDWIANHFHSFR